MTRERAVASNGAGLCAGRFRICIYDNWISNFHLVKVDVNRGLLYRTRMERPLDRTLFGTLEDACGCACACVPGPPRYGHCFLMNPLSLSLSLSVFCLPTHCHSLSVLCLPSDFHSLFVNHPSSSSLALSLERALGLSSAGRNQTNEACDD